MLIKNINRDLNLIFGIFSALEHSANTLDHVDSDITALCHDNTRLSLLMFSNLQLTPKTLYAYYQPQTKPLLLGAGTTNVNVGISGL